MTLHMPAVFFVILFKSSRNEAGNCSLVLMSWTALCTACGLSMIPLATVNLLLQVMTLALRQLQHSTTLICHHYLILPLLPSRCLSSACNQVYVPSPAKHLQATREPSDGILMLNYQSIFVWLRWTHKRYPGI